MPPKKATLKGRKRISELGNVEAGFDKKSQLLAIKEKEYTQVQKPVIPSEESVTPPAPEKKSVKPSKPVASPSKQNKVIEVGDTVDRLASLYQELSEAGTAHRRAFSLKQVESRLRDELKKKVNQKAQQEALKGTSLEHNQSLCQGFVDDVLAQLRHRGIALSTMFVRPVS